MVRALAIIVLISCLITSALANTQLQVTIFSQPDQTIELGKPLWLELSTEQLTPSLDTIDFTELGKEFYLDTHAPIKFDSGQHRQIWRLRLYAYTTGNKIIPSLRYVNARSTPLTIKVNDAIDPKTQTPIQLHVDFSHDQHRTAWVREQIQLRYMLITDNRYSQFLFPHYSQPGVDVRAYQLKPQPSSAQTYEYILGWSMHAQKAGLLHMILPPLQLISDGVPTHHFYVPPLQMNIKTLPIYVPATMPVGRLDVEIPEPWHFTFNHHLAQFPLNIIGYGIPVNQLPAMGNAIQSTATLRTYPMESEMQDSFTADGIVGQASYQIPYKPISQGWLTLPPTKLDYFDPHTGTVKSLDLDSVHILSANRWLGILFALALLYLLYRLGNKLYRLCRRKARQLYFYHQAMKNLPAIRSAEDIRKHMALVSRAETWPDNLSVNQWLKLMLGTDQEQQKNTFSVELNYTCYQANATFDGSKLQKLLRELSVKRHPVLKFVS